MPAASNIANTTWNNDDWSKLFEELAQGAAGAIPVIGGAASFLIGKFWPESDDDDNYWQGTQNQVQNLIDTNILKAECQERQGDINGVVDNLRTYSNEGLGQQREILVAVLTSCTTIFDKLKDSDNRIHLIPVAVVFSHVHMIVLAEQSKHGSVLWPGDYQNGKQATWDKNLEDQLDAYLLFFRTVYQEWSKWRLPLITSDYGRTNNVAIGGMGAISENDINDSYGKVTDSLNNTHIEGASRDGDNDSYKNVVQYCSTMMTNRVIADMANLLSPTFLLNSYVNADPPNGDPALSILSLGPFSSASLQLDFNGTTSPNLIDKPGQVVAVLIQQGQIVDGFQLQYASHMGNFSGPSPSGGMVQSVVPTGSTCTGFAVAFAGNIMQTISPYYSNVPIPEKDKPNAVVGSSYAVQSAKYSSDVNGISYVLFDYVHSSLQQPINGMVFNSLNLFSTSFSYFIVIEGKLCSFNNPSIASNIIATDAQYRPYSVAAAYPVGEKIDNAQLFGVSGTVFLQINNRCWAIPNPATFNRYNLNWQNSKNTISTNDFNNLTQAGILQ